MADNLAVTAGSGTTIAADDIGGVLHQRVKISQGADGTAADVSSAAPLQVTLANTGANATKILVTPDLPTGASTAAKQPALGTAGTASADVITIQGIAAMTALKVDGSAVTQPVSGTVTANLAAGVNNIGDVDVLTVNGVAPAFGTGVRGATVQRVTIATDDSVPVTGTFFQATQPVSIATNTPVGTVAHDAVDSGAPVKVGGRAINAEITAIANNDRSDFVTDLAGKLIVLPYANPENFVSGAITAAMTGTTSTSLIAAPAAGLRNYLTTIIVSNAHATVGTDVVIQDGSGGATLATIPAAAVYGGAVINLPVPLRQPTTATAIFCANVTTGASTKVSAFGYKGV